MAIDTVSRKYSDNLRRFRRYLQGHGINFRETIITGAASGRLAVPGLHDDDPVVSVFNMTDINDATGYLDVAGAKAQLVLATSPNGMTFTARVPGTEGNKIYLKAAAAPGNSLPLSVDAGAYDDVLGTTGNPGKTAILINLATNSSGVALTDGTNDQELVRAAILAVDAAERIIDVAEVESPYHDADMVAFGPSALTGGAAFKQGPTAAKLVTDSDVAPYGNDFVLYTATQPGARGNSISVAYTAGAPADGHAPTVTVTGDDIVVTYEVGVTTVADVIKAVNAKSTARAWVLAQPYPAGSLGDELIATMGATSLSGGLDPAIQLTLTSENKKLRVAWFTHDERDEDTRA